MTYIPTERQAPICQLSSTISWRQSTGLHHIRFPYPQGGNPGPLHRKLGGHQSRAGCSKNKLCPCLQSNSEV